VAVATNAFKKSLFTIEERMEMCRVSLADYPMVSIDTFDGPAGKIRHEAKARAILRGLRAVTDFELRISAGHDEPAAGTGNRDGVSHDRPALGILKLQHFSRKRPCTAATSRAWCRKIVFLKLREKFGLK